MPSQFQVAMMIGAATDRLINEHYGRTGNARAESYCNMLVAEYGWRLIGKGYYAAVFDHPYDRNLVIKIGSDMNDGWLSYAAFCMRNHTGCSPLLEVHEIALFERCYVAVMERLEDWRSNPFFNVGDIDRQRELVEGRLRGYRDGRYDDLVAKMHKELGTPYDLHQANVMVRSGSQLVWTDPYSALYGEETYDKYKRGNRVQRTRTTLAPESESPAVRVPIQDNVLWGQPKHDNRAQPDRVQSALLPRQRSRRVRTSQRDPDHCGVAGTPTPAGTATVRNHVGRQRQIAERLLRARRDMQAHVDMAREVRHKRDGGQAVRDRLQPVVKPHDPAYIRPPALEGMAREKARERRSEIRHARLMHDVLFHQGDFAVIEKRIAAHLGVNGGLLVDHKGREARTVNRDPGHVDQRAGGRAIGLGWPWTHRRVA